jgi:N-acetylglucosamine kinase-like BadF-type ATPase
VTIYLGVDAGVTKTRAAVCDEAGRLLGSATAGFGSVEGPGGVGAGVAEIGRAVAAALAAARCQPTEVASACYAVAGDDGPEDEAAIRAGIAAAGLAPTASGVLTVVNDGYAALRGGLTRTWGVVSSAGTGTVVVGRGPEGRLVQVGGVGPLSGDAAGGAHLGLLAVQRVMMAEQGALAPTRLRADVVAVLGTDDLLAVMWRQDGTLGRRLAPLAPAVFSAAANGDAAAQEILIHVGTHLGRMATGAIAQLGLLDTDVEVALAGGTYRGASPLMADAATLQIHRRAPRASVHRALREPVAGALVIAREAHAGPPDEAFLAALGRGLPEPGLAAPLRLG